MHGTSVSELLLMSHSALDPKNSKSRVPVPLQHGISAPASALTSAVGNYVLHRMKLCRRSAMARADICSAANLRSGKSNSRGIEPEALRGHVGEFVAVQNNNDTSLQVDYSLLGPRAQLLIRALARSTNDLANLALRDGEFRR